MPATPNKHLQFDVWPGNEFSESTCDTLEHEMHTCVKNLHTIRYHQLEVHWKPNGLSWFPQPDVVPNPSSNPIV